MKNVFFGILIAIVLLLSLIPIPKFSSRPTCQLLPMPYKTVLGMPWKASPCGYSGLAWGPSLLEYVLSFTQSIDKNGFYFLYTQGR